jgi:uncharacterized protein YtpQ (UPF0354 family)
MSKNGHWRERLARLEVSEQEYTELMLQAIQERFPEAIAKVTEPRTICVESGDQIHTLSLDNAWLECIQSPDKKAEVFQRYLNAYAICLTEGSAHERIAPEGIIPIIKSCDLIDNLPQNTAPFIIEPLAADLVVVYVVNTDRGIVWLHESDVKDMNLQKSELRELAVANLRSTLHEVRRDGDGGIYGLVAGGNYESSLLLSDRLWDNEANAVCGELVASVPCRDLIFYTGTGSRQLLLKMTAIVNRMFEEGSHKISPSLIVRRSGKWVELENWQDGSQVTEEAP